MTLNVTPDALPEGLAARDITIKKMTPAEGDENTLMMYMFGPDGVEFNEPIDIEVKLEDVDIETKGIPLMVYTDDESMEPVSGTEFSMDLASKTATFTGKIEHFSTVAVIHGFFAVSYPGDLGDHKVLEPFPITINVTTLPDARVRLLPASPASAVNAEESSTSESNAD